MKIDGSYPQPYFNLDNSNLKKDQIADNQDPFDLNTTIEESPDTDQQAITYPCGSLSCNCATAGCKVKY